MDLDSDVTVSTGKTDDDDPGKSPYEAAANRQKEENHQFIKNLGIYHPLTHVRKNVYYILHNSYMYIIKFRIKNKQFQAR